MSALTPIVTSRFLAVMDTTPIVEWRMHANHKNKSAAKLRLIEYLHQEPLMASILDGTLDTWVKTFSLLFLDFASMLEN